MITIPIQVSGDAWNNQAQVKEILDGLASKEKVNLDLCSEGPSLAKIGLISLTSNYDLEFYVSRWANNTEIVPYNKIACQPRTHFYPMSRHYWTDKIENTAPTEFRFGLFLGRSTLSRNRILYDAATRWPNSFLLSKMRNIHNPDAWIVNPMLLESIDEWYSNVDEVREWFKNCPISSVDDYTIQDQFKVPELSSAELALSLFEFYKKFNVELVCETYTLGDTFFPTEKTVRPMVGNRPFIVYGPKGFLANLKQQEGFKTFSDLWDESYDNYEGRQRWDAIAALIDHLMLLDSDQWANIIQQASAITEHNRIVLENIIHDRKKL